MKIEILARKHDGIVITHYPSGHETDISKATFSKEGFNNIREVIHRIMQLIQEEVYGKNN